jgi:hypothetical protein
VTARPSTRRALSSSILLAWASVACGEPATLTRVQSEVFALSCNFAACHGGASPQKGLGLEGATYRVLVGVPAAEKPGAALVEAGEPDRSYLLDKLLGRDLPAPPMGERWEPMPPPAGGLDPERVELVRAWIDGGAADD